MSAYERFRQRLRTDQRFARVLQGGISGLAGRGLTLLISAFTLPLTLRYLGRLEYGIWVTVSTSVVMLSILDLGIASTLNNFIAEAYAEDDREKAGHYFATAFWITGGIVALLSPVVFLAWRAVSWGILLHLTNPLLVTHARQCAAIAGAFFLCSLPLSLASRVLGGYQQVHLANYFNMANGLCSLAAILITIGLHGSVVVLMAAYSGSLLIGPFTMNVWLWGVQRPYLQPTPARVRFPLVRRLFGQGILFFLLQISGLVVFNSDNLVLAHYLGADAVTPYSVAWRITQYAAMFQGLFIPSLWPAFTEAYHRRQMDWVRSTYHSLRRKSLTAVGVLALLIGVCGQAVIRVWAGPAAVPGRTLLWLMALFAFVMASTTNQALLLSATGRLQVEAAAAVVAAIANLVLSIHLVKTLGPEGVILSTLLSFLIFMLGPQAWEVRRVLKGHYLPAAQATGAHRAEVLS